jgi:hypothetical protein
MKIMTNNSAGLSILKPIPREWENLRRKGKQSRATRNYLGWSDPMILYHYTNLNPFFGDDEQAEAARQGLGRGEQPPRAFTVLRPSSTQHPEWKPVVWLTSEPDVDRGRVPDEPPISTSALRSS